MRLRIAGRSDRTAGGVGLRNRTPMPRPAPRPAAVLLALLGAGCAAPGGEAGRYLAFQREDGGYVVAPRPRGTLGDLVTITGDEGGIRTGGIIVYQDDGTMDWEGGRALDVGYGVQDGVAVPLDEDGLVLWSFYGHLEDVAAQMPALGLPADDYFPLDAAWTPILPDLLLELLPKENAAYATGGHFFILLDDLVAKDVPLAANAGVIRHELGHAVFHVLTTGAVNRTPPFSVADTSVDSLYYSCLHEGFADIFASLSLDDPDWFEDSLPMTGRDLTGDWTVEDAEMPEHFHRTSGDDPLAIYDPYPLGTVFASTAWDLGEALGDPLAAWDVVLEGTRYWVEVDEPGDAWGLLEAWVEAADPGVATDTLCASIDARFGDLAEVEACP